MDTRQLSKGRSFNSVANLEDLYDIYRRHGITVKPLSDINHYMPKHMQIIDEIEPNKFLTINGDTIDYADYFRLGIPTGYSEFYYNPNTKRFVSTDRKKTFKSIQRACVGLGIDNHLDNNSNFLKSLDYSQKEYPIEIFTKKDDKALHSEQLTRQNLETNIYRYLVKQFGEDCYITLIPKGCRVVTSETSVSFKKDVLRFMYTNNIVYKPSYDLVGIDDNKFTITFNHLMNIYNDGILSSIKLYRHRKQIDDFGKQTRSVSKYYFGKTIETINETWMNTMVTIYTKSILEPQLKPFGFPDILPNAQSDVTLNMKTYKFQTTIDGQCVSFTTKQLADVYSAIKKSPEHKTTLTDYYGIWKNPNRNTMIFSHYNSNLISEKIHTDNLEYIVNIYEQQSKFLNKIYDITYKIKPLTEKIKSEHYSTY